MRFLAEVEKAWLLALAFISMLARRLAEE